MKETVRWEPEILKKKQKSIECCVVAAAIVCYTVCVFYFLWTASEGQLLQTQTRSHLHQDQQVLKFSSLLFLRDGLISLIPYESSMHFTLLSIMCQRNSNIKTYTRYTSVWYFKRANSYIWLCERSSARWKNNKDTI